MSTNLSGNALTLNNTSLNGDTLNLINDYYYVPDDCKVGDTVILDGIECLCVATGVTIQGSNLTRIAVDKNHDLGYYQKYVGINIDGTVISKITRWRWGGHGTAIGNNSIEVGYGLQNTINCLANTVSYTSGTSSSETFNEYKIYPLMWTGVNDFRASHSDKWFLPSRNELLNYVHPYKSSLNFDTTTGGPASYQFWSSTERSSNSSNYGLYLTLSSGNYSYALKYNAFAVRLCRAF